MIHRNQARFVWPHQMILFLRIWLIFDWDPLRDALCLLHAFAEQLSISAWRREHCSW